MKKLPLLLAFVFVAFAAQAQDKTMESQSTSNYHDYNHWSIELEGGVTKPLRPVASGYATETPSLWQADLGVRYMINDLFGFKLGFGYNHFESSDSSLDFESQIYRTTLQGVVNAGTLLGFRDWTNTLNFLVHAGAGYGVLSAESPVDFGDDEHITFIAGITPQVRLSNHFAVTADLSFIGNARQDRTFDGSAPSNTRGFDGMYMNGSIGITYYIGAKEKSHADWYNVNKEGATQDKLGELSEKVSKIEDKLKDTDRDGVPDYLDKEDNTPAGIAVDAHGRTVDNNNNSIPDELEDALDARYQGASESKNLAGQNGLIASLLNDGYVNVYFKFDSTEPTTYSLQAVNYLIRYMEANPSAKAELVGYADEIGNVEYNKQLSMKRAEKVKEILVASGIDANRLSITAGGEDGSVKKSSSNARQLVRRVTFKLK